jgi:hypothetical protein
VVTLGHLTPGARVVLTENGAELGETDASDTACNFQVPPLQAGATIEAHMQMCNGKGPSAKITVAAQGAATITVSQTYTCAAWVEVSVSGPTGMEYLTYVTNHAGQQISAFHNVAAPYTLIPVFPGLVAGDAITVHVLSCGGIWAIYGPTTVLTNPPQPVVQQPLWAGYNTVEVSAAAGFVLYVYVDNVMRASAITLGSVKTGVTLPAALHVGDSVTCAIIECGELQKQGPPVIAAQQPPQRPVLIDPPDGAGPVVLQPLLKWQDPGQGTPAAATSFAVTVTQGSATIVSQSVATTSITCPVQLMYATAYKWDVTSSNSGGQASAAGPFQFKTENPPAPHLQFVPPMTTACPATSSQGARGSLFQ